MSDGLPTEEQLRRMEQRVMSRIRRRAELPKRIAGGAAATALVVGGVFLLPRLGGSGGGGSSASGGGGGSRPEAASVSAARCHAASTADSPAQPVSTDPSDPVRSALDACLAALRDQARDSSGDSAPTLQKDDVARRDLLACLDDAKVVHVFVRDAKPSTLCARNGMHAAP